MICRQSRDRWIDHGPYVILKLTWSKPLVSGHIKNHVSTFLSIVLSTIFNAFRGEFRSGSFFGYDFPWVWKCRLYPAACPTPSDQRAKARNRL